MIGWLLVFAIVLAMDAVAYAIMPKPKAPKPDAVQELEAPQASAGSPIFVAFGTVTVKEVNVLYYGEKQTIQSEIDV